jgi:hypothetical protein
MTLASPSISSIGQICATLQRPYGTIRKTIESLGITPVLIINMVAHYSDDDVERLREALINPNPREARTLKRGEAQTK